MAAPRRIVPGGPGIRRARSIVRELRKDLEEAVPRPRATISLGSAIGT
jgi:hypothetical protein